MYLGLRRRRRSLGAMSLAWELHYQGLGGSRRRGLATHRAESNGSEDILGVTLLRGCESMGRKGHVGGLVKVGGCVGYRGSFEMRRCVLVWRGVVADG